MLVFFLRHLAIFKPTLAANQRCPEVHFSNDTACLPCSVCPPGERVMRLCGDTKCQSCCPGFDYFNTTEMEACLSCDQNSNCLPGNFKVIKNCTVSSITVYDGCEAGFYFNKNQGERGGCVECSPLCRVDEVETKGCKTEHDRVCSKRALTTENILNPTTFWKETDYNGTDDTTATLPTDDTDKDPIHEAAGAGKRQEAGLDQPIQTLLALIGSFGDWRRLGEKLGQADECRAFNSQQSPTQAFLTLYSEKRGSTVRTLVNASEVAGLTHFASKMREKFVPAQDHEEIEAREESMTVLCNTGIMVARCE
ncbi:uncharacterized protein [Montipora foliosa]|uniref:uncharacterized protein isoform X2 n=1 Tax=Montipora foliosa TaxID=591990 RepID=UPI0035F181F4